MTSPAQTIIDLATVCPVSEIERLISEADRLDLISPEELRSFLERSAPTPGAAIVRRIFDRKTFRLTDSELERLFIPLATRAGLPVPLTRQRVNGYLVDFYWPDLGLVVGTDGLRYHRTASAQSRDARRDQVHTAAGLTALRFSHEQVHHQPAEVEATLRRVHRRLQP